MPHPGPSRSYTFSGAFDATTIAVGIRYSQTRCSAGYLPWPRQQHMATCLSSNYRTPNQTRRGTDRYYFTLTFPAGGKLLISVPLAGNFEHQYAKSTQVFPTCHQIPSPADLGVWECENSPYQPMSHVRICLVASVFSFDNVPGVAQTVSARLITDNGFGHSCYPLFG